MADPKYAHLSGIAYDQPDIYETTDLPEADQAKDDLDEESESVERLNISATEAFSRFRDKTLNGTNVDFSDRLSKRRRIGYDVRSGDWELVGAGEKETLLQKYQRLQCEMKELVEEINTIKEDVTSKEESDLTTNQVENMLKQLEGLRLEKSLSTEVVSTLSDPQGAQLKKLLSQLEKVGRTKESDSEGTGEEVRGQQGAVRYSVNSKPSQAHLTQASRLADLEARVNRLNALVATTPSTVRRLGGGDKSLMDTAKWVAAKSALLEPAQLDAVEARMFGLLTKLDQVAEKSASITGSTNTERDNKISELYELAKTTEEMSQVLPKALERMTALEALHEQGVEFAKSLAELESLQTLLAASCESNKESLLRVEQNFAQNLVTMKTTIEGLDARIKALTSKVKK